MALPDLAATRHALREAARRDAERARARRAARWRMLWLVVRLGALAALIWAAWRIGYETGAIP